MTDCPSTPSPGHPARIDLQTYSADIQFSTLPVGVDNLHYDVSLSARFVEFSRKYLLDLLRMTANLAEIYGMDWKNYKAPEKAAFRKHLADLLQASLTRAQFEKNIELDLLLRVSLLKFLTQEIGAQFSTLVLECKDKVRARGEFFERSEQAHVIKARLAELQGDRRNITRQAGQHVYGILVEIEESSLARLRRALFGEDFHETYELLKNRLLFVEGGKDDSVFLEHYVLLGNFVRDLDRFEVCDALLLDFLKDFVLAGEQGAEVGEAWKAYEQFADRALTARAELSRLEEEKHSLLREQDRGDDLLSFIGGRKDPADMRAALADVQNRHDFLEQKLQEIEPQLESAKRKVEFLTEQYQARLGDYLNQPRNARLLFDSHLAEDEPRETKAVRARLLEEWIKRLENRELLLPVLAAYELRNIHLEYCPPVHLQQLKKALVHREELARVEEILGQFPARRFSLKRIEDVAKTLRRYSRDQTRAAALRFAEDFMRLRRDLRNYQRLQALMERINLIRIERTRELSRLNNTLCEYLLPDESRPAEDRVLSHVVIKADVRGSTKITQDLLARGLNPASHFSLNLYEPIKRFLERYGAAKVFIEGDAIILAIYETESNRAHQRAVAKACLLGREILSVARAYNLREESSSLPRMELGVGVAFQNSPPTYWMDSDSRLMISRALNLSDRLSSCSKLARRLLAGQESPFRLFLFHTLVDGASEEDSEELLLRYNLNGVELNEEGFTKLSEEIALASVELDAPMPWGRDLTTFYLGEVPLGESLEKLVIRKGHVRQLLAGGKIGGAGTHAYYEVCTSPEVLKLVEAQLAAHPEERPAAPPARG